MPNVTATPRGQSNGQVLTEFIDSVGTSSVTYTYPKTQESLSVRNIGTKAITVTVGGTSQALQPGQKWENTSDFTSFSIVSSSGVQAFEATADEKGSVFSSPEGRYFASLPSGGGALPSNITTVKPISVARKTNIYINGWSSPAADHQAVTYKQRHYANVKFSFPQLMYGNWTPGVGDQENTVDATIAGSIEDANGNIYPATFNGNRIAVLSPGATIVSDPVVGLTFAQDEVFYTRNYISVGAGGKYPLGCDHENGTGEGMGQGNMTVAGSVNTAIHERQFHPISILGIPDALASNRTVAPIFIGDSITAGNYGGVDYSGHSFPMVAGEIWHKGVIIAGLGGDTASQFKNMLLPRYRISLAQYATHAIVEYGFNDLYAGGANNAIVATIQADLLLIWNRLVSMGLKVYACTLPPRTNSTDAWATTANQTPVHAGFAAGAASKLGQLNAWIRTIPAPLSGIYDLADAVMSARDSGVWKLGYTDDGVHPDTAGVSAIANIIDLSILT